MTHIYQPIMIRTMLESPNYTASTEAIAKKFLNMDESQLNYYKSITKRWPHKTLVNVHKIAQYNKNQYTLLLDTVTREQKQRLIELCNLRLAEFIDKDPWIQKFRELDKKAISGSLRYDVFAKSKSTCLACGVNSMIRPLHVDHIIPASKGGRTELDNLQTLCSQCNLEKNNRDETDFLLEHKRLQFRRKDCKACHPKKPTLENNLAHAVYDQSKKSSPCFVYPNRHVDSFMQLRPAEKNLCISLAERMMYEMEQHNSIKNFDVRFDVPSNHYAIHVIPK